MEDDKIKQTLANEIKINEDWLNSQRNRLMGAISQLEDRSLWAKLSQILVSARSNWYIIQIAAAVLFLTVGYFWGQSKIPIVDSPIRLEDLLSQGSVTDVQLVQPDWASGNLKFKLTAKNNTYYSGPLEDESTLQLLHFMLQRTKNEGQRQELVSGLVKAEFTSDLALGTIVRALLDENNLAIQFELLDGLKDSVKPIVKQALLGLAMGEYPVPLRLKAVNQLDRFSKDEYVRRMLEVIAIRDPNSSIRYTAQKILGGGPSNGGEIAK